jgi:hypothetical protein
MQRGGFFCRTGRTDPRFLCYCFGGLGEMLYLCPLDRHIDSRDDVVTVVLFPDDSKNHPFCYLSAKTKKKNIFLPIYLENWNKYITFAA